MTASQSRDSPTSEKRQGWPRAGLWVAAAPRPACPEHWLDGCRLPASRDSAGGAMLRKAGSVYFPGKPWKKPNQEPDTAASACHELGIRDPSSSVRDSLVLRQMVCTGRGHDLQGRVWVSRCSAARKRESIN